MSVRVSRFRDGRSWEVDIRCELPDGTRYRERKVAPATTRKQAEMWAEQRQAHLVKHGKRGPAEVQEAPTLTAFVEERWMTTYPAAAGNRPTTVHEKAQHWKLYLKPILGRLKLDQITPEAISKLLAYMNGEKFAPKTIKNVRATLRTMLGSAVKWGVLEKIPEMDRVKVPDVEWDFFTAEEARQLLNAARNDEERAILTFALQTGARAGELLAFEWGDIDWLSRKVIFRRSRTGEHLGPTKSGKQRKLPLTAELVTALKAIRHAKGALVFSRGDGKPLSIWQLHQILWATCRRAGLRKIRWHDLRHSFGSQLVQANVSLRQVQEWLGHGTINMTMRYAHLAVGASDHLIEVLSRRGDQGETRAVGV